MIRLNAFLRNAGVGSRRKVEELILSGRVSVHGTIIKDLSTRVEDGVAVDGRPVEPKTLVYYQFYKPKGFLYSHARRPGEALIYDIVPKGLFSVGRLDKDTTGLLLLTNDGTFANRVIHPSANIEKEYIASVAEPVTERHLRLLRKGMVIEGAFVQPLVRQLEPNLLSIIVHEGKKREVRLLVQHAGLTLTHLHRLRIGGLTLSLPKEGSFKPLTLSDCKKIYHHSD